MEGQGAATDASLAAVDGVAAEVKLYTVTEAVSVCLCLKSEIAAGDVVIKFVSNFICV